MDDTDPWVRRRAELDGLPAAPAGQQQRAAVLDDGTAETYLALSALRSRGWQASVATASRSGLLDLLADPPHLLVVSDDQTSGRGEVAAVLRRVHAASGHPEVVTLTSAVGGPPRPVRRLRLLAGLRRDRFDGGPPGRR